MPKNKKMKGGGSKYATKEKSGSTEVKNYDPKNTGEFPSGSVKVSNMHKKGSPEG